MIITDEFFKAFILTTKNAPSNSAQYKDYTLKLYCKLKEIRLLKGSRKLASYNIELEQIQCYSCNNNSEKIIVGKFAAIHKLIDDYIQRQEENKIKNRTLTLQEKEEIELLSELEGIFKAIKDNELDNQVIKEIVDKVASKHFYQWYGGGNPDHFNDHYINYVMDSKCRVEHAIFKLSDQRVINLITKPIEIPYWKRYSIDQLRKMIKFLPIKAQREGNHLTINKIQQEKFLNLTDKALKFASNYIKDIDPEKLIKATTDYIYWWEEEAIFFTKEEEEVEVDKPITFRQKLLKDLTPKTPKKKNGPSPSRLEMLIYLDENDVNVNSIKQVRKTYPYPGIVLWKKRPEQFRLIKTESIKDQ